MESCEMKRGVNAYVRYLHACQCGITNTDDIDRTARGKLEYIHTKKNFFKTSFKGPGKQQPNGGAEGDKGDRRRG